MAFAGARGHELPLGLHLSALLEKLGVGPHADTVCRGVQVTACPRLSSFAGCRPMKSGQLGASSSHAGGFRDGAFYQVRCPTVISEYMCPFQKLTHPL